MLTRFVRIQLAIFTIAAVVGMLTMVLDYMQAPTLFGVGRMKVTLELPAAGGLYRFSDVTYRGVQVGKVTAVDLMPHGVKATLSLDTSSQIPADLQAEVRSVSAVGEQYVDLRPRTDSAPYLRNGSVIPVSNTKIPQPVGPLLDRTSALLNSIPKDNVSALLDESFKGFNGAGYDFGSLLDSSARLSGDLKSVSEQTRALTDDAAPLLDSQAQTTDAIRLWARSIAGVTGEVVNKDPEVRSLLETGPGAFDEVSRLLDQVKPTLPVLLANLTTIGQVGVTYHPSIEQVLVLLPPYISMVQSLVGTRNPTGLATASFSLVVSDPPACTVGFLPPSQWRSPADTTTVDTPDGLYCKLPQDSPIAVRGARNYPCMGHPGKRAPTVEICNSDKPFQPLAMRQHVLGASPVDPNLLAQGIPPDDRIAWSHDRIFGPVEGTPLPPGVPPLPSAAPEVPPAVGEIPPIAPLDVPGALPTPPDSGGAQPQAAPSSVSSEPGPSLAVTHYDPQTGNYVGPDGQLYRQTDLAAASTPKRWQDMLPS